MTTTTHSSRVLTFDRILRFEEIAYPFYFRGENDWDEFLSKLGHVTAGYKRVRPVSSYVVLTDSGVPEAQIAAFMQRVASLGRPTKLLIVHADERNKTLATIEYLSEEAQDILDKSTCIISFGGGFLSNVAGLWAHLQYRGLPFVAVHTTLLSLQDVAPSLKQGVNNKSGKNQFGAYQAPTFVWGNVSFFDTLPAIEIKAAFCELAKNVLAIRPDMFQTILDILRPDAVYTHEDYRFLTQFCLDAKSHVMVHDAHEELEALCLEYGHTCGHAFELIAKRKHLPFPLPHGIAIGLGMLVAALISHKLGRLSERDVEKHFVLLQKNGIETRIPKEIEIADVLALLKHDNKRGYVPCPEGMHPMILLDALGQPFRSDDGKVQMPTLVQEELIIESILQLRTA